MLVKIEARILIFRGTDFHFPSTSVPPGTFLGSATKACDALVHTTLLVRNASNVSASWLNDGLSVGLNCQQCNINEYLRRQHARSTRGVREQIFRTNSLPFQ